MSATEYDYTCPDCGTDDIGTIHDDLHYCDNQDCRASLYNPLTGDVTWYPVDYAIGFCPRCGTDSRSKFQRYIVGFRSRFECPECEWQWTDQRVDPSHMGVEFYKPPYSSKRAYND